MGYDVYVGVFLVLLIFRRLRMYVHVHRFPLGIHTSVSYNYC